MSHRAYIASFEKRLGIKVVHTALNVLDELRSAQALPKRIDACDDALVFLFIKGMRQASIDCYSNGELVVAWSDASTRYRPKVRSYSPSTEDFRKAIRDIQSFVA